MVYDQFSEILGYLFGLNRKKIDIELAFQQLESIITDDPNILLFKGWSYTSVINANYNPSKGKQIIASCIDDLQKLAESDDAYAQNNLGYCYYYGIGAEKNPSKAIKYYRCAVDQGNFLDQHNLARCYEDGQGVVKDLQKALYYYHKSADQGDAYSQISISKLSNDEESKKYKKYALVQGYISLRLS